MNPIRCSINDSKGMSREKRQELLPTISQRLKGVASKSLTSPVCQRLRFQEKRIDAQNSRSHMCGIGQIVVTFADYFWNRIWKRTLIKELTWHHMVLGLVNFLQPDR